MDTLLNRGQGLESRATRSDSRQMDPVPGTSQRDVGPVRSVPGSREQVSRASTLVMRGLHSHQDNVQSQASADFATYLKKSRVQDIFRENLRDLLSRPELPYNPYPGFCGRIRQQQERFHLFQESSEDIQKRLDQPLQETRVSHLYTLTQHEGFYGLSNILRVISPTTLNRYRWLVSNLTPVVADMPTSPRYSTHVTSALVGPCVFHGSLYPEIYNIQVRLEFVISGSDEKKAQTLFANHVLHDIQRTIDEGVHVIHAAVVTTAQSAQKEWTLDEITAEKDEFIDDMLYCVQKNTYIRIEGVFLVDPGGSSYMTGQKQYGFNFLQVYDEPESEDILSFCEFPMGSLHEGVFFDNAQAEGYVTMFEVNDVRDHVIDKPNAATHDNAGPRLTEHIQKGTYKLRDEQRSKPVVIDGFRLEEDQRHGAFAWKITTPIRAHYQKKIAGMWPHLELLDIVHCVIILVTMDSDVYAKTGILEEIYRLLHGTAGRLCHLMEHSKSLRAVIQTIANRHDRYVLLEAISGFRSAIVNMFADPLVERSNYQVFIGLAIVAMLDDVTSDEELDLLNVLETLDQIQDFLVPLVMEAAESSLAHLKNVNGLIRQMETMFPDQNPMPTARYIQKAAAKSKPKPRSGFFLFQIFEDEDEEEVEVVEEVEEFKHGFEDERLIAHETSVIVVEDCMTKDTFAPPKIVLENVLMRYMLDCHFDDVWNDYLTALVDQVVLPPNPLPRLSTILRQSAMKMNICEESPTRITERMFNLNVQLDDKDNFVFRVPDVEAFGSVTALMLFEPRAMANILDVLKLFQQKSYIQKKGPYRVGICLALSGPCIWYGRMLPYLNEVQLHEHYYIQGPSGCHGEAIQLCALVVHNHMVDMINKSGLPVMGVYFGSPSPNHWTSDDVLTKKKGFLTQFATTCNMKEPIYAKAYVILDKWRYVTLVKHFMLHFLEEGTKPQIFYPEDHAAYYLSIFLSKERAAFHYQNCGPPNGGDPMGISNVKVVTSLLEGRMLESQRKMDWLSFYRHLLLRDLITQDQSKIADCWRVFHSMTGQVEYVTGMMEVIQDLVITCLVLGVDDKQSRQSSRSGGKTKNPVDQKILTKMVMAFYQKLMYVCEARLTMAARALTDYIENKLKSALEFDPETGQPFLALEDQTIFRLEEMKSIMKIFQDTLGGDVRSVCQDVEVKFVPQRLDTPKMILTDTTWPQHQPRAPSRASRAGLAGVQQGQPVGQTLQQQRNNNSRSATYLAQPDTYHRPDSVASNMLDDPNFYRKKRATNMMTVFE